MSSFYRGVLTAAVILMPLVWLATNWWPSLQFGNNQPFIFEQWFDESPRERYARQLSLSSIANTPVAQTWSNAYHQARQQPLDIQIPYAEKGRFLAQDPTAFAYQIKLTAGQHLRLTIQPDWVADDQTVPATTSGRTIESTAATETTDTETLFLEIWQSTASSASNEANKQAINVAPVNNLQRLYASELSDLERTADNERERQLVYAAEENITLLVVLQAPLLTTAHYALQFELISSLTFPVQGRDVSAIKSFYGAARDGGARRHKGVDVFAPRNTPLVAVTDGWVTSTRSNKLGGKVVWLRKMPSGPSYYYAHLETVAVSRGDRLLAGEVLGTVGNSGNARSTPPHLHFGIYTSGGTIDPLPILSEKLWSQSWRDIPNFADVHHAETTIEGLNFRAGPGTQFPVLQKLPEQARVSVLASTPRWLRVSTESGQTGFIASRYAQLVNTSDMPESPRSFRQAM